jgi:hypothetical protein
MEMKKPKDHAVYLMSNNRGKSRWVDVFYEDYSEYDNLPEIVKDDDTEKEYEDFWEWKLYFGDDK